MKVSRKLWILLTIVLLFAISAAPIQASGGGERDEPNPAGVQDNLPDPLTTKQLEQKQQALEAKLNGKALGKTHEVARGQYVELARAGEGAIWTVLGEFADVKHNQMPQPDRTVDNTTFWVQNFDRAHYMDLLFNDAPGTNSMRNFYVEQSSNRYTVHGDVTDWIAVSGNAISNTYDNCLASGSTTPKYGSSLRRLSPGGTTCRSQPARPQPRSTST